VIKDLQVQVDRDSISYKNYPLPYPRLDELRLIKAAEVELIFAGYDGYQILLRNGNVVLFPREKEMALYEFVRCNRITTLAGIDPWNLLTEPYLDQSYTPEETQKTIARLGELGFEPGEVEAIRKKVGPSLLAYNSFVWEWVSMGLLEVLDTNTSEPEGFYRWAISISKRGYQQAKPCDLIEHRRKVGMSTILWSKFEVFMCRRDLWRESAAKKPGRPTYEEWNPVYEWLFQQYSEPHRYYHNLYHLEQVTALLESQCPRVSAAAQLAGWFHDAVYRAGAASNEEESAEQMCARFGALNVDPKVLLKAKELVLYTQHHKNTTDEDERMVHDADLGIFGLHHDAYAKYASDIRKEYASVPDDLFKQGRTEILQQFLHNAEQKGRFFYVLDPIFERQVEANLRWEIATLNQSISL
jgi:predicted metal-dependent HD superfamily phosphohydrolase